MHNYCFKWLFLTQTTILDTNNLLTILRFSSILALPANNQMIILWFLIFLSNIGFLTYWFECLPMVQWTRVQFQVKSCQRLRKWYLVPPCFTLSVIKYWSRVSEAIQGEKYFPPLYLGVEAIEKGAFGSLLTTAS